MQVAFLHTILLRFRDDEIHIPCPLLSRLSCTPAFFAPLQLQPALQAAGHGRCPGCIALVSTFFSSSSSSDDDDVVVDDLLPMLPERLTECFGCTLDLSGQTYQLQRFRLQLEVNIAEQNWERGRQPSPQAG
jgi:hypothetical protein